MEPGSGSVPVLPLLAGVLTAVPHSCYLSLPFRRRGGGGGGANGEREEGEVGPADVRLEAVFYSGLAVGAVAGGAVAYS